ncbi:hypothetical protein GGF50DRAFT_121818 [Schizophyllum commune]
MHDAVPFNSLSQTITFEMPSHLKSPRHAARRRSQAYARRLGSIVSDIRLRMRDGSPPTLRNLCLTFRQDEHFAAGISRALGRFASTLNSDQLDPRFEFIRPNSKWVASIYFLWDVLRLALPGPKWYSKGPLARPGFLINCMRVDLPVPPRYGRTALRRASSRIQDRLARFDNAEYLPDTWVRDEALRCGFGEVVLSDCHPATAEERAFSGRMVQARRRGQLLPGTERVDTLPLDPNDDVALGTTDALLDALSARFLRLLNRSGGQSASCDVEDDGGSRRSSGSQRQPLFLPSPTPDIPARASPSVTISLSLPPRGLDGATERVWHACLVANAQYGGARCNVVEFVFSSRQLLT